MNRTAVYAHWTANVLGLLKLQRAICDVPIVPTFGNRIFVCALGVIICRGRLGGKRTPSLLLTPHFKANHLCRLTGNHFFYIHIKNYTTCYIYVLLYFLITLQQYHTTATGPQGARDNDYPVAINIKTYR